MKRSSLNRTVVALVAAAGLILALPSFASALSFQETSQSPLPGMTSVTDIATGDFDNDGNADMAVSDEAGVVIWLSNGDGTFLEGQTLPIEPSGFPTTTSVAVGDFNGDGKLDLVYSDPFEIYVALGSGNGTFVAPTADGKFLSPSYLGTGQVAAADLNGDGNDDVVYTAGVHSESTSDAAYHVLLSDGDGTFTEKTAVPLPSIPVNSTPAGIAVGDYNNDGKEDLALLIQPFTAVEYTDNQILGEAGQDDGTFTAAAANPISLGFTEASYAYAESTADLDGSGGEDLLVTATQGYSTIPLLGSSSGFLGLNAGGAMTGGASLPTRVTAADLDGDGLDDAITSYFANNGSVGVGLGDASGDLTPAPGSPFGVSQEHFFGSAVAAADFDGDGHPDIAFASNANTNGGPLTQGVAVLISSPELGLTPDALDFGDVEVGETATGSVTLSGLGAPDAELSQVVLSSGPGSPFSIVDPSACETVAYGEECELEVEYAPLANGAATNTLVITSNTGPGASSAVSIVPLSGRGVTAEVGLTPSSQDFGSAEIGAAAVTKSLTIHSSGGAPLTVTAVSVSGSDFKLADPSACVRSLAAGASCDVAVSFTPSGAAGSRSATLTVETDAGTRTAQLNGTATVASPPPPAPAANTAAKLTLKGPATVKAGKQVKLKVQVSNTGNTAIAGLALTAKAPKKLAKPPKAVSVASLGAGQSASRTIVVKLKEAATAGKKLKLTVNAVAAGRTLATGTLTVKVK